MTNLILVETLESRIFDDQEKLKCLSDNVTALTKSRDELHDAKNTLQSQLDKAIDEGIHEC